MKKDYSTLSQSELHDEHKKLNKKLIIPNILIVIIAIVACVTQMFMPFLKVSFKVNKDVAVALAEIYEEVSATDDGEETTESSDNAILTALLAPDTIASATENLNVTISLQFTALDLLSVANAKDEEVEDEVVTLLAGVIDKINIKDELETALTAMMPKVVSVAVTETVKSLSEDLTEEQAAVVEECTEVIESAIESLSTAETITEEVKEEVKTDVKDSVTSAMENIDYSEEDIAYVSEQIDKYFDTFIDCATDEEGNFSYVTLIENLDTLIDTLTSGDVSTEDLDDIISEITGEDGSVNTGSIEDIISNLTDDNGNVSAEDIGSIIGDITSEDSDLTSEDLESIIEDLTDADGNINAEDLQDAIANLTGGNGESYAGGIEGVKYSLTADTVDGSTTEETTSTTASISHYIALLDDSEALVRELIIGEEGLSEETLSVIKLASVGVFIFISLISVLWVILALIAFIRIFTGNKKVGMWYVKLFGGLAAILFFLVPTVLILFAENLLPLLPLDLGAYQSIVLTICGATSFGGSGIIVLICLLVLWLVSIFYCHPIKKRIRACGNYIKE